MDFGPETGLGAATAVAAAQARTATLHHLPKDEDNTFPTMVTKIAASRARFGCCPAPTGLASPLRQDQWRKRRIEVFRLRGSIEPAPAHQPERTAVVARRRSRRIGRGAGGRRLGAEVALRRPSRADRRPAGDFGRPRGDTAAAERERP